MDGFVKIEMDGGMDGTDSYMLFVSYGEDRIVSTNERTNDILCGVVAASVGV